MSQPILITSALAKAEAEGFPKDFFLQRDGSITCDEGKIINPKVIEIIPCLSCGCTLYTVSSENVNGNFVDYWDI